MNTKPTRYLNSPNPPLHTDRSLAHHRAIAVKHQCYHQRRNAEIVAQRRAIAVTLILLTVLAASVAWLVQSLP